MPLYAYACGLCEGAFDVRVTVERRDDADLQCPARYCDGQLVRVYTPPAVVFKGTGWASKG